MTPQLEVVGGRATPTSANNAAVKRNPVNKFAPKDNKPKSPAPGTPSNIKKPSSQEKSPIRTPKVSQAKLPIKELPAAIPGKSVYLLV